MFPNTGTIAPLNAFTYMCIYMTIKVLDYVWIEAQLPVAVMSFVEGKSGSYEAPCFRWP